LTYSIIYINITVLFHNLLTYSDYSVCGSFGFNLIIG